MPRRRRPWGCARRTGVGEVAGLALGQPPQRPLRLPTPTRASAPHLRLTHILLPHCQAVRLLPGRGEGPQGCGAAQGRLPDCLLRRRKCVKLALSAFVWDLSSPSRAPPSAAVAGCTLFFDVDLDAMVEYVCECAAEARATPGGAFRLRKYVAGAISRFANEDTPAALHGNLEVSVTQLPSLRNKRVTDFSTYEAMTTHLLATSCIVPLAGLPMWVPGSGLVLDGGLSDLQVLRGWRRSGSFNKVHEGWGVPPAEGHAAGAPKVDVCACPFFMSRAAIKPDKPIPPTWAFYPPEPERLRDLYRMGTRNTNAWIASQAAAEVGVPRAPHAYAPPSPSRAWRAGQEYAAAAAARASNAAHGAAHAAEEAAAAASALAAHVAADAARALESQRTWLVSCKERGVKAIACALIYAELCAQAGVSTAAAAMPQVLGVTRERAWARARSFVAPLPGVARLAVSAPHSPSTANLLATHTDVLNQLSLLYRMFAHALL